MTSDARAFGGKDIPSGLFINTGREKYNEDVRLQKSQNVRTLPKTKTTGINDKVCAAKYGSTRTLPERKNVRRDGAGCVNSNYTARNTGISAGAIKKQQSEPSFTYCFLHGFLYPALKNAKTTIKELCADSAARANEDVLPKYEKCAKLQKISYGFVFYLVIFSFLLIFLAMSYGKVNEYTCQISELKSSISEYNAKARMLEIQIDSRDDLRFVEHEAVTRLGMIKEENVQKKYISLRRDDIIEVNPDSNKQTNVSVVMSGAAELLSDLFR